MSDATSAPSDADPVATPAPWLGLMPLEQLLAAQADDATFGPTALALARQLRGRAQRQAWRELLVLLVEWDTRVGGLDGRLIALQPVLRAQLAHWCEALRPEARMLQEYARALLARSPRSAAELRRARWFCSAVQEVLTAMPGRRIRTRKADRR